MQEKHNVNVTEMFLVDCGKAVFLFFIRIKIQIKNNPPRADGIK